MEYIAYVVILFKSLYLALMMALVYIAVRKLYRGVSPGTRALWLLLSIICMCEGFSAFESIVVNMRHAGIFCDSRFFEICITNIRRVCWITTCICYLCIAIFFEKLVKKHYSIKFFKLITRLPVIYPIGAMLYVLYSQLSVLDLAERQFEFMVYGHVYYYVLGMLLLLVLYAEYLYAYSDLPRLVKQQSISFSRYLLLPNFCSIIFFTNYTTLVSLPFIPSEEHFGIVINDCIFSIMLIYMIRHLLRLRLLGVYSHVQRNKQNHFVEDLKHVLIDLSMISSPYELRGMVKRLFARSYGIAQDAVELYVRPLRYGGAEQSSMATVTLPAAERLLQSPRYRQLIPEIIRRGVLIREEVEFDAFYEDSPLCRELIELLDQTQTDVFIPIYEQLSIVGYIAIARNARPHELFSGIEHDEMLVYANHLTVVIHLLQHRTIQELVLRDKEAQEELYTKQHEINHYKESIRALLYDEHAAALGVALFYGKKITWMSDSLRSLLALTQDDACTDSHYYDQLVHQCQYALRYGVERTLLLADDHGRQITAIAVPCIEEKLVVIVARYANRAELVMLPFAQLTNIAEWEYALYLQTTESGRLINQLVPGTGSPFLNFKLDLLKAAMSRRALLLDVPQDDLTAVVTLIHHISNRALFRTVTVQRADDGEAYGLVLYGLDTALHAATGLAAEDGALDQALLLALHKRGTLFIRNIDLLSVACQDRLAEFITTGMFRPLLSERRICSDVRIICSLSEPSTSAHERCTQALRAALAPVTITMPSLLTVSRAQLETMVRAVTEAAVDTATVRDIIDLNSRDLDHLLVQRPTSITDLKQRVNRALQRNAEKHHVDTFLSFDESQDGAVPANILQIIRMGKRALHDQEALRALWNHFGSQAKIAHVLKVHRSSVHRRCKDFNIITPDAS